MSCCVGHLREKINFLSRGLTSKSTSVQVLRGEVLESVPEAQQPTDSTKVAIVGIERKSLRLGCPTEDMTRLSEEETNLLLAITSSEGRYQTSIDRKRLEFGRQLSPGSAVSVEVKGASQVLPGIVWYRGILPPYLEIWFGVELTVSTRALVKLHCRLRQFTLCKFPTDSDTTKVPCYTKLSLLLHLISISMSSMSIFPGETESEGEI